MRQMGLNLMVIAGLTVLAAPIAQAGVTCKLIPAWCPADHGANTNNAGSPSSSAGAGAGKTSVPEPATLLLLGAGVSAVGVAMRRRRKD
jgi:PEP-CTERM motif